MCQPWHFHSRPGTEEGPTSAVPGQQNTTQEEYRSAGSCPGTDSTECPSSGSQRAGLSAAHYSTQTQWTVRSGMLLLSPNIFGTIKSLYHSRYELASKFRTFGSILLLFRSFTVFDELLHNQVYVTRKLIWKRCCYKRPLVVSTRWSETRTRGGYSYLRSNRALFSLLPKKKVSLSLSWVSNC